MYCFIPKQISLCFTCSYSLSFIFICCTTRCITRCHSLSFAVTRCHSSIVVPLVVTRYHSLSLVVPLVVTCCHFLSLDVLLACLFINDPYYLGLIFVKHLLRAQLSKLNTVAGIFQGFCLDFKQMHYFQKTFQRQIR